VIPIGSAFAVSVSGISCLQVLEQSRLADLPWSGQVKKRLLINVNYIDGVGG